MLSAYLQAAMNHAKYEILPDDGRFYGEIPVCPGVWATADTLEQCRSILLEVLEDWLFIGIAHRHPIPIVDGIELTIKEAV